MSKQYRTGKTVVLCLIAAVLAGCQAAQDRSDQQEAVEYTVVQHDAARCADAGLLPGSTPFNDCMAKLEPGAR